MIEIEKKYRLTAAERDRVLQRLSEAGAENRGEEFEENTIYAGGALKRGTSVLRLRRVGARALLTYKERFAHASAVKQQRESAVKQQREEETARSEEHTSELQSPCNLVCRLLLETKKQS